MRTFLVKFPIQKWFLHAMESIHFSRATASGTSAASQCCISAWKGEGSRLCLPLLLLLLLQLGHPQFASQADSAIMTVTAALKAFKVADDHAAEYHT